MSIVNPNEFISKNKKSSCVKCGAPNKCALEEGRSITACWCYGVDIKLEIVENTCMCRSCLENSK